MTGRPVEALRRPVEFQGGDGLDGRGRRPWRTRLIRPPPSSSLGSATRQRARTYRRRPRRAASASLGDRPKPVPSLSSSSYMARDRDAAVLTVTRAVLRCSPARREALTARGDGLAAHLGRRFLVYGASLMRYVIATSPLRARASSIRASSGLPGSPWARGGMGRGAGASARGARHRRRRRPRLGARRAARPAGPGAVALRRGAPPVAARLALSVVIGAACAAPTTVALLERAGEGAAGSGARPASPRAATRGATVGDSGAGRLARRVGAGGRGGGGLFAGAGRAGRWSSAARAPSAPARRRALAGGSLRARRRRRRRLVTHKRRRARRRALAWFCAAARAALAARSSAARALSVPSPGPNASRRQPGESYVSRAVDRLPSSRAG